MALPHERDQSTNTTATAPDPKMLQAKRDIDAGLVDTDICSPRENAGIVVSEKTVDDRHPNEINNLARFRATQFGN